MGVGLHTASALMLLTTATAWANPGSTSKALLTAEDQASYSPFQDGDRERLVAAAGRTIERFKADYQQQLGANNGIAQRYPDIAEHVMASVVQLAKAANAARLAQLDNHLAALPVVQASHWGRQLDALDEVWVAAQQGVSALNLLSKA